MTLMARFGGPNPNRRKMIIELFNGSAPIDLSFLKGGVVELYGTQAVAQSASDLVPLVYTGYYATESDILTPTADGVKITKPCLVRADFAIESAVALVGLRNEIMVNDEDWGGSFLVHPGDYNSRGTAWVNVDQDLLDDSDGEVNIGQGVRHHDAAVQNFEADLIVTILGDSAPVSNGDF